MPSADSPSPRGLDTSAGFLWNAWYPAAWSHEVSRTLLARTLLGTAIVLYRLQNGEPAALVNRCPHRFAPLDRGSLHGDELQCGYHGLRFASSGRCVHSPHGDGVPPKVSVRSFPLVERYGLIWIWMGQAECVEEANLPAFEHLVSRKFRSIRGSMLTAAHYEIVADNLLDLSHTQFVHGNYLESDLLRAQRELAVEGTTVHLTHVFPTGKPPPIAQRYLPDADAPVDQTMQIRWDVPSLVQLTQVITPVSGDRTPRLHIGTHLLTPETPTTTHYFYASSRSFGCDSEALDALIREWHRVGFGEQDKPMVEAVQRNMGTTDLMALRPLSLAGDAAALRARRILRQLIDAQSAQSTTSDA